MPSALPARILVVDDDEAMRIALRGALGQRGSTVLEAANATEARSLLAGGPLPDVIVSDVRMPGENGFELVRDLRARGCNVPVLFLTGFGDAPTHADAREIARADILDKPFDLDELRAAVIALGEASGF